LKVSVSLILEIPITRANSIETELSGALGFPGAKRDFLDFLMTSGCVSPSLQELKLLRFFYPHD
jgi:hypothetical protein